jgi:hypothetical protein
MKCVDFLKSTGFVIILERLYLSCYITITRKTVSDKDMDVLLNFLYEQLFTRNLKPHDVNIRVFICTLLSGYLTG